MPAPQQKQGINTGDATTPGRKQKQRLRDFLRKTVIYSQNIQGSGKNKTKDIPPWKFDYITKLMKRKNIDVYLIQETWISDDYDNVINGHHIFHHGTPEEESAKTKGRTKGGVAIILSPLATEAWIRAGQPDPIKSGMISGCARYIALALTFIDHLGKKVKVNVCSVYHPTGINQQERSEFLSKIDNLYDELDKRSGSILIAGCDINSSIGTRNSVFGREDGSAFTQDKDTLGPHGIDYLNEGGTDLLQILRAKSLVAATTFFKHKKYTTWRQNNLTDSEREEIGDDSHIRNPNRNPFQNRSEYQLDHFLTQKKHLSKILDARNITDGAPSDHKALKLVLRIATKLTKRPANFNIRGEKKKSKPIDWKKL